MSLGFNSDVTVAQGVCHVQTEERDAPDFTIETLVYHHGRVLHRRNSSYAELANALGDFAAALRARVEAQHQEIIDALRSGKIAVPAFPESEAAADGGIEVRLLNAKNWHSGGQAALEIEVVRREGAQPAVDAEVEAFFETTGGNANPNQRFNATTDAGGRSSIQFAMPRLGPNGAELVLRARLGCASDEVRFALRPRVKLAPPEQSS